MKNKQLTIDRAAQWQKDNPKRNKELRAEEQKRRRKRCPEKFAARNAVNNAVLAGTLVRGTCEVPKCDVIGQAHHDDYSKPLDVRWLCIEHHNKLETKV